MAGPVLVERLDEAAAPHPGPVGERAVEVPEDRAVHGPERSDDDRDGAAVDAPGRAGDVARPVGAEEDDHGGDLRRGREASERPARADLREHLVALALLVGEAALAEPGRVAVGPGVTALQRMPSFA